MTRERDSVSFVTSGAGCWRPRRADTPAAPVRAAPRQPAHPAAASAAISRARGRKLGNTGCELRCTAARTSAAIGRKARAQLRTTAWPTQSGGSATPLGSGRPPRAALTATASARRGARSSPSRPPPCAHPGRPAPATPAPPESQRLAGHRPQIRDRDQRQRQRERQAPGRPRRPAARPVKAPGPRPKAMASSCAQLAARPRAAARRSSARISSPVPRGAQRLAHADRPVDPQRRRAQLRGGIQRQQLHAAAPPLTALSRAARPSSRSRCSATSVPREAIGGRLARKHAAVGATRSGADRRSSPRPGRCSLRIRRPTPCLSASTASGS